MYFIDKLCMIIIIINLFPLPVSCNYHSVCHCLFFMCHFCSDRVWWVTNHYRHLCRCPYAEPEVPELPQDKIVIILTKSNKNIRIMFKNAE